MEVAARLNGESGNKQSTVMSAQCDSLPKMSSSSLRLDAVGYGRPEAVFFGRRADVRFLHRSSQGCTVGVSPQSLQ